MENVANVILCINTLHDHVSGHPIDLNRMSTHVVMGYETKIEVLSTCGPMDRLEVPHLAINDHVNHQLHYHVHAGLL